MIGAGRQERRYHDYEQVLATGVPACAVRHLPEKVYPIAQTGVEIVEDENWNSYREPLMLLWSDGYLEYVRHQLPSLPELDKEWLKILSKIRSGRQTPDADFHARQKLMTLLSQPEANDRPYSDPDWDEDSQNAICIQICEDIPLKLVGVSGIARNTYYFSDDIPDPELLKLHVDTNLSRLTHTYTTITVEQADVLELPPGRTLEDLASDLIYVQMAQNEENLGITWYLTEPREREFAQVLMMTHPQYRLHPPGTPTHGELDLYLNWESRARACTPEELRQHITPAQRIALLRLLEQDTESEELRCLIRARIRQLERHPESPPLDYDHSQGHCRHCHQNADLNQFSECPKCGSNRLISEFPENMAVQKQPVDSAIGGSQ